ncbi:hypothetical protein ACQJBY_059324 [Aegilops geniculata]
MSKNTILPITSRSRLTRGRGRRALAAADGIRQQEARQHVALQITRRVLLLHPLALEQEDCVFDGWTRDGSELEPWSMREQLHSRRLGSTRLCRAWRHVASAERRLNVVGNGVDTTVGRPACRVQQPWLDLGSTKQSPATLTSRS